MTKKKSKDYYLLLVTEKVQPPNIYKWKSCFNLSVDNLREFFLLPHSVELESYVKAFQYKVLHNILYTIKHYSKSVSEQMMFVPFVRLNQKLYTISFTNVLTRGDFGTTLSLIGAVYQINRFVCHCRMLYLVSYLSNALQPNY